MCIWILALILSWASASRAQQDQRILVLSEADSRLPLTTSILAGMQEVLGESFMTRGDTYVEHLDMFRFESPEQQRLLRELLIARYGHTPLDAVVVLGPNAMRLALDNRDTLAAAAPIVFTGISKAQFATLPAAPRVSGTYSGYDPIAAVALARRLQPEARELVIITGSGVYDRQWREAAGSMFADSYQGLSVRYLDAMTLGAVQAEVEALDPSSIVLMLTFTQDATGRRFIPRDAVRSISARSGAPLYGVYDTYFGHGIVGGVVDDSRETGRSIGRSIRMILDGKDPPPVATISPYSAVDWNELKRWGLDRAALPADTRIKFYEPTAWERYRAAILTVAAILLAQTATIAALIVQRGRAQRAQAALALERQQLIHVSRNMRLGQLSGALAHEINQPLAAILANAEAGARLIRRTPPDIEQVSAILDDIATDDRRAAGIIAGLRRLMVKGETSFEQVDLNEVVRATLLLAESEFIARGTTVEQDLSAAPLMVQANVPQMQQIVLNLTLNAAEAMSELPAEQRVLRIATQRLPNGKAELVVEDRGPGVDKGLREEVFRPFFSTKDTGLGIGLSICRNIAKAHGGGLDFADHPSPGAKVELTLPLTGDAA
ncbi:MAG: ATP-binding protein [Gemmobacter sp.]